MSKLSIGNKLFLIAIAMFIALQIWGHQEILKFGILGYRWDITNYDNRNDVKVLFYSADNTIGNIVDYEFHDGSVYFLILEYYIYSCYSKIDSTTYSTGIVHTNNRRYYVLSLNSIFNYSDDELTEVESGDIPSDVMRELHIPEKYKPHPQWRASIGCSKFELFDHRWRPVDENYMDKS